MPFSEIGWRLARFDLRKPALAFPGIGLYGFKNSRGSETIAKIVQAMLRAHVGESYCYIHIDFSNAFNGLDRDRAMLVLEDAHAWFLKPYETMLYGHGSVALYGSDCDIPNRTGVIPHPQVSVIRTCASFRRPTITTYFVRSNPC